jgi:hypothetical protein
MDQEMSGVIARIRELAKDLSEEYHAQVDEIEVSERAKRCSAKCERPLT